MENNEQKKESKLSSWTQIIGAYICIIGIVSLGLWLKGFKIDIKISIPIEISIMILIAAILLILENKLQKLNISTLASILIRGLSIVLCSLIVFAFIAELFNIAAINDFCTFKPEVNFASVASIMIFSIGTFISLITFMLTRHKEIKEKIDKEKEKREDFIEDFNKELMLYIKNVNEYLDSKILNNDVKKIYCCKYKTREIYAKLLVKIINIEVNSTMIDNCLHELDKINRFEYSYVKSKKFQDGIISQKQQVSDYLTKLVEETSNLLREYKKEENIEKAIKKRFFSYH